MEEQFQQKQVNYNTRQKQQRASEIEEGRKERLKKRNEKDRERRAQRLKSRDEDGEVQDLAVLKRIRRAAESRKHENMKTETENMYTINIAIQTDRQAGRQTDRHYDTTSAF